MALSFPSFFFEQSFDRFLVGSAAGAGVFFLLALGAAAILRRWLPTALRNGALWSLGIVLLLWAVGLTLFEAAALWYRTTPPGSGRQRFGADHDAFLDHAELSFFAFYAGLVVLAFASTLLITRLRGRISYASAIAVTVTFLAFLVLTFPSVEFSNSCNVGQSFVLNENNC